MRCEKTRWRILTANGGVNRMQNGVGAAKCVQVCVGVYVIIRFLLFKLNRLSRLWEQPITHTFTLVVACAACFGMGTVFYWH